MKTSHSATSIRRYLGRPLSVLRVMEGSERDQPMPNWLLPNPESYASAWEGVCPERPTVRPRRMVSLPVPVAALASNFSPIPRMAPPPLESSILGAVNCEVAGFDLLWSLGTAV